MYLVKYSQKPSKIGVILLFSLCGLICIEVYFFTLLNGLDYIFQNVIGQMFGAAYLVLCLTFDSEVHRYCEKTGFLLR